MADRIFDLFAAQFGTSPTGATPTQIVGPAQLRVRHGFAPLGSNHDGAAGEAAVDKGPYSCAATLNCGDVSTFMAVLAAFEGASDGLRALVAEGKEVAAATVSDILIERCRLVAARLACRGNQYADVSYDLRVSCDSASAAPEDEFSVVKAQTKTATIGAGKRTYRVVSATHGAVQALACAGFDLNISGQAQVSHGDDEFGETVDVGPYQVRGSITFADFSVATLKTKVQQLQMAALASLVIVLKQQGGGANTTLTLANCKIFDADDAVQAGQFAQCQANFACEFVSGTTPYALASGADKIVTMA